MAQEKPSYTVRRLLSDDSAIETMRAIKDAGYYFVQTAGDLQTVEKQGVWAKNAGHSVVGSVIMIDMIAENIDEAVRVHKLIGACDIGVSGFFSSALEVEEFIGKANKVADALARCGITFSYHNHSGEFIKLENGKKRFRYAHRGSHLPKCIFYATYLLDISIS